MQKKNRRSAWALLVLGAALLAGGGAMTLAPASDAPQPAAEPAPVLAAELPTPKADLPMVHVWKSPTCGCCSLWVEHLRKAGFEVHVEDRQDMGAVKAEQGVPAELHSCHTATVDGYVLEGHVPAEDVLRLLEERPEWAGLATPGMPVGSPGMEYGDQKDAYDVMAFDRAGKTSVWASH